MADDPNQQEAAEQLALVLTNHGLQRMTARVLATLLFTEETDDLPQVNSRPACRPARARYRARSRC